MVAARWLRTLLVMVALAACSDDSVSQEAGISLPEAGLGCKPETCPGCCLAGSCVPGNTKEACGSGGLACVICEGKDTCAQGQCLPFGDKCNPTNCMGCCQADSCVAGDQKESCGKGGLPCEACASSQKCEKGSCGCSPTTCSGCCDAIGICRSGTEAAACGSSGGGCKACSSGNSCGPSTCQGCCASGKCEAGTSTGACGRNGASCQTCGSGESCQNGVCNNPSTCGPSSCTGCCQGSKCLSGVSSSACGEKGINCHSCASIAVCQTGVCKLKASSLWGIIVVSAELDSKDWDWWPMSPPPDPYVEITVGSATGKTTVKDNTTAPQWDEYLFTVSAGAIAASNLLITVYDDDAWLGKETIGTCTVFVPDDVLASGWGIVDGCGTEGHVKKIDLKFIAQ
jgi:hypothetical protein